MAIGGSTSPTKTNINPVVHEVNDHQQTSYRDDNNPGVRIIGNRIYCALNGKICHQCRQKPLDFAAFCKNLKGNKECPIKFCHKCLKNRLDISCLEQRRSDAVRTQPIFMDPRGSVFWKLSASIGESDVLLQGLTSDSDEYEEKWLSFDD